MKTTINFLGKPHTAYVDDNLTGIAPEYNTNDLTLINVYRNDCSVIHMYKITDKINLFIDIMPDDNSVCYIGEDKIIDYLVTCDFKELYPEWLSDWGIDPFENGTIVKASENYEGNVMLWDSKSYNHTGEIPYGAPRNGYIRSNRGELLIFNTYAEALEYAMTYVKFNCVIVEAGE